MKTLLSSSPAGSGGGPMHIIDDWFPRQRPRGMTIWAAALWLSMVSLSHAADYGDVYVDASIGDASFLNPILMSDSASGDIVGLVFNGLVKYDKDIQLVGDLAKSWEVTRGGLVITFHLHPGVRWHDGVPFTADDVVFTYQKLRDPKVHTPYSSDFDDVESVVAQGPLAVRVTYRKAFAPGLASWGIGIVPKHVYEPSSGLRPPSPTLPWEKARRETCPRPASAGRGCPKGG